MIELTRVIFIPLKPIFVSYLHIDCDVKAERMQVIDRFSGVNVSHKKIREGKYYAFLPESYSHVSRLICIMLDDNGEFNAAAVDNVQPMLIDLITFNPNNPLPYEPPP